MPREVQEAVRLMCAALDLLDAAGEDAAACRLQAAIDAALHEPIPDFYSRPPTVEFH